MYHYYNPNPYHFLVGDCVIRACSKLLCKTWDETYLEICSKGFEMKDMPASNKVWDRYLRDMGYSKSLLPDTCPDCYSLYDFCEDYPYGRYLVGTGTHVVAVIDGDYYDTWDSGGEVLLFYYKRR